MGRAIVREPQAFLMDEPLSNLDAKLRVSMRASLNQLHDRLKTLECVAPADGGSYEVTPKGSKLFAGLGIDVEAARNSRRRFAFGCLDWSERRSHLGGAMGAALLKVALTRKWVRQELDSRALSVTRQGEREIQTRFGVRV